MVALGNLVFLLWVMFDECFIMVVGHTFFLRLGLPSGSIHVTLSLICFGCLTVKLRSSMLKAGVNSMFHVWVCLICEEITLVLISIICAF